MVDRAAEAEARQELQLTANTAATAVEVAQPPHPTPAATVHMSRSTTPDSRQSAWEHERQELLMAHAQELEAVRERARADCFRQVSELKANHARELHAIRMKASQLTEDHDMCVKFVLCWPVPRILYVNPAWPPLAGMTLVTSPASLIYLWQCYRLPFNIIPILRI